MPGSACLWSILLWSLGDFVQPAGYGEELLHIAADSAQIRVHLCSKSRYAGVRVAAQILVSWRCMIIPIRTTKVGASAARAAIVMVVTMFIR